jgi:hypothetical protein
MIGCSDFGSVSCFIFISIASFLNGNWYILYVFLVKIYLINVPILYLKKVNIYNNLVWEFDEFNEFLINMKTVVDTQLPLESNTGKTNEDYK